MILNMYGKERMKEKMGELVENIDSRVLVQFFTMGCPVFTAGRLSEVEKFKFVEIRDIEAVIGDGLDGADPAKWGNFIKIPFISMGTAIQLIEDRESGKALFNNSFVAEYYSFANPNAIDPIKVYALIETVFGEDVAKEEFGRLGKLKIFYEREKEKMEKKQFS